jgi:hypothetical protein
MTPRRAPFRHGRACPGYPRLGAGGEEGVDGRSKFGRDGKALGASCTATSLQIQEKCSEIGGFVFLNGGALLQCSIAVSRHTTATGRTPRGDPAELSIPLHMSNNGGQAQAPAASISMRILSEAR